MKKYQQLCLVILSIFSFLCLLIYRHEYNKLRYVLEVLNFFGSPGMPASASRSACEDVNPLNDFFLTGPLPAWQRISNSLYVYSAFWEKVNREDHAKAYAVVATNDSVDYGCHLWYDSEPKMKTGQFNFTSLNFKTQDPTLSKEMSKSKIKPLVLHCKAETTNSYEVPIGVTFFEKSFNSTQQAFVPLVNIKSGAPPKSSVGICLMPNKVAQFNKSNYLEFLNFHKLIGINNFIVYGSLDLYELLSSVHMEKINKVKIMALPWNFPFSDENEIFKVVAENDCRTRMRGFIENVAILEWNKFLVPRYSISLGKLLNQFENGGNKSYKFVFSTLLFCTEYKDNALNSSLPIIFRKVKYSLPKIDLQVPIYRPHLISGRTQKVAKDIVAVHQYSTCQQYKLKLGFKKNQATDMTMLNFQGVFFKSQKHVM